MDRETTINYMRKAVACFHEDNKVCLGRGCSDCPHDYPVENIDLIESALKLLEGDGSHSVAKEGNPKESGAYNCTCSDGTPVRRVTTIKYNRCTNEWAMTGRRTFWKVLAWRPLPEAYTEEEFEEDRNER